MKIVTDGCSLLIPCHNAAQFLPRLWETVRAQRMPFAEIVCYDDASTDNTPAVARSLGARVIGDSVRRGPAHARNQLMRAAACDWVHFHDADDLLHPEFLSEAAARLSDAVDAVICDVEWLDEDTRLRESVWRYERAAIERSALTYVIEHPIGGINGVYRRSVLERVDGFDERYACWEDSDLHVRLAGAGARFTALERVLCFALRRPGSLSEDQRACYHARLLMLTRYADEFGARASASVARQAEHVASQLLQLGDASGAGAAIALCERLGAKPPTTSSRTLTLLKGVLPPVTAMRLQRQIHSWARWWVRPG